MAIIGVMGSGSTEWVEYAEPLGRWIAQNGHDLLTGGGQGVMLAVSRAFSQTPERRGKCIGILPTQADAKHGYAAQQGYPNPYVDIPVITPLPKREDGDAPDTLNRNYVNILTSDVVVALPGAKGTRQEITLAMRFNKPVICLSPATSLAALPAGVRASSALEDIYRFISENTRRS